VAIGFVLIRTEPGKERIVMEGLEAVPEVVEVHSLFGEYDLIAKLEAADPDQLGHVVVSKVRSIVGVATTLTLAAGPL
jgi:DNA-binding Lrp family transcriptional regulator